ncbi:hypothetical protein [Umezakia ovalisporum]|uniref:Uncharacterized protein n=1 Tax=Umezakia ovalisporum FSS-62 TaxID=2971776 RepID=A0AA43KFA5_9CYAN|nr:hypothetical protein [Umezakia ovalisporum]MDH6063900.1 hypothetical protein [Umezakia ovalisporum FSS-62]MDH6069102.1 hypothetical protein [Umezakia ovalisporum APH033B]MDH6075633.1 hypothetical protein [Umezakia ovalisporum CS-1034]MDH6086513.1 hypothetical protein [Umezakia ovalisporum TAC611]
MLLLSLKYFQHRYSERLPVSQGKFCTTRVLPFDLTVPSAGFFTMFVEVIAIQVRRF